MLPASPNRVIPSSLRRGDSGWPTFALQSALRTETEIGLVADGAFGPATESAVRTWQRAHGLVVDGIAGIKTQRSLVESVAAGVHILGVPDGHARGLMDGESGFYVGAVNWSVPGGVDCGVMQRRVYTPYAPSALKAAYAPLSAIRTSMLDMQTRALDFLESVEAYHERTGRPLVADTKRGEYAWRLAALAHNWPWAADQLSKGGMVSTTKLATWAPASARFPDGAPVRTQREWCEFYALGGVHGEGRMTKYVKSWPR